MIRDQDIIRRFNHFSNRLLISICIIISHFVLLNRYGSMFHRLNRENDAICHENLGACQKFGFTKLRPITKYSRFDVPDRASASSWKAGSIVRKWVSLSVVYNSQTRYRDIRFVQLVHSCRSKYSGPPGLAEPHGRYTLSNNTPHGNRAHTSVAYASTCTRTLQRKLTLIPDTVQGRAWCATL